MVGHGVVRGVRRRRREHIAIETASNCLSMRPKGGNGSFDNGTR